MENLRVDYYLLLKCSQRQSTFFLPGPNHLQLKFNSKMQDVKRVLDLNLQVKGALNNLFFSLGFQISKI